MGTRWSLPNSLGACKTPAALRALGRHASLETVLASLAGELGASDHLIVHDTVEGLSRALADVGPDPVVQLGALGDRVGAALSVQGPGLERPRSYDDLRPDVVLGRLAGDELVLAASLAAIGRRAGFDVDVMLGARHALVAHHGIAAPLVLSLRRESRTIDAGDLDDELRWADPHDVAAALVGRLDARAALLRDVPMRTRAIELALAVPGDRPERRALLASPRGGPALATTSPA